MNPTDIRALQLTIIQALESAAEGQSLEAIHEATHRPRRDLAVLPQVSAMVSGGLIEKVVNPADTTNRPVAGSRRPNRSTHSVRFRLTQDGRSLLIAALASGEAPRPVAIPADDRGENASDAG